MAKDEYNLEDRQHRPGIINFVQLFRFATCFDVVLILVGSLFAIVEGAGVPAMALVFGQMTNTLVASVINGFATTGNAPATVTDDDGAAGVPLDPQEFESTMAIYSLLYVGIGVIVYIASLVQITCWQTTCERQTHCIRLAFFRNILRQEVGWFDLHPAGDLSTKLNDDIERIHDGIGEQFSLMVKYASSFISGFVVGFIVSWRLTLIILIVTPLLALFSALLGKIIATSTMREQEKYAKAGAIAEEILVSIRTVLALNGQRYELRRFAERLREGRLMSEAKYIKISLLVGGSMGVLYSTYGLALYVGSKMIAQMLLDAGSAMSVLMAVMMGASALGNIVPSVQTITIALSSATTIYEIIDMEPQVDAMNEMKGLKLSRVTANIKFEHVTFSYPKRKQVIVLDDLNLDISQGQTIAICGKTGSGKSTIMNLLLRFYDPDEGAIYLDNCNLCNLNVSWLRSLIAVVEQEPALFDCSIYDNIALGLHQNPTYNGAQTTSTYSQTTMDSGTYDRIIKAAKLANAHDFIVSLPQGYETRCGDSGHQLSGGQKQRISIARAIVKDPKILLLDEATSALDSESEALVQVALNKARQGRTTIIVAHRLSTIREADVICVMDGGKVIEIGRHDDLMAQRGHYYGLVTNQVFDNTDESGQSNGQSNDDNFGNDDDDDDDNDDDDAAHESVGPNNGKNVVVVGGEGGQVSSEKSETSVTVAGVVTRSTLSTSRTIVKRSTAMSTTGSSAKWSYTEDSSEQQQQQSQSSQERTYLLSQTASTATSTITSAETIRRRRRSRSRSRSTSPLKQMLPSATKRVSTTLYESINRSVRDGDDDDWTTSTNAADAEKGRRSGGSAPGLPKPTLSQVMRLCRNEAFLLIMGVVAAALAGALMPTFALFYAQIFDTFTKTGDELLSSGTFWALMFLLLGAVSFFVMSSRIYLLAHAIELLTERLRNESFTVMIRQHVGWFDEERNSAQRLTTRLASDIPMIKSIINTRLATMVSALATVSASLIIAFYLGWKLAMLLTIALPLLIYVGFVQMRFQRGNKAAMAERMESASRLATECVEHVKLIQAIGQERYFCWRFKNELNEPYTEALAAARRFGLIYGLSTSAVFFVYAAAFRYGAYLMARQEMQPVDVFRVFFAIAFTAVAVGQWGAFSGDYSRANNAVAQIIRLLSTVPKIDNLSSGGIKPNFQGAITFSDVHFRYPTRQEQPVLQGINLTVPAGKTVALVGASGCGKSTLAQLLLRFYDPDRGVVKLDQFDIRCVSIQHLRQNVGIVAQEPVLFRATIRENIVYGLTSKQYTFRDIVRVSKLANIHDFIESLPDQYDTQVGERGVQMSGGQRQRIAIARALIRNPVVLILDEATSALDTESEALVNQALDEAGKGRTCIKIAHRLSTVRDSDMIAVIERGRIVESGTHDELMAMGKTGIYYRLMEAQNFT